MHASQVPVLPGSKGLPVEIRSMQASMPMPLSLSRVRMALSAGELKSLAATNNRNGFAAHRFAHFRCSRPEAACVS